MSLGGLEGANRLTVKHLDGENRPFTAAVITVGSLWMATLVWDRGFLDGGDSGYFFGYVKEDEINEIAVLLLATALLFIWAIFDGFICFMALLPNIRMEDLRTSELNTPIMLGGFFGLLGMNVSSIVLLYFGQAKFEEKKENGVLISDSAHYFIYICLIGSLLVVDGLFMTTVHREHVDYRRTDYKRPECPSENKGILAAHLIFNYCGGFIICSMDFLIKDIIYRIAHIFLMLATPVRKQMGRLFSSMTKMFCKAVFVVTRGDAPQPETSDTSTPGSPGTSQNRVTTGLGNGNSSSHLTQLTIWSQRCLRTGAALVHTQTMRNYADLMDTFAEDSEDQSPRFRHSPWVLGGMITTGILLVFFGLMSPDHVRDFVFDIYQPVRSCVSDQPGNCMSILEMDQKEMDPSNNTDICSQRMAFGNMLAKCNDTQGSNPAIVVFSVLRAVVAEDPQTSCCDKEEHSQFKKSLTAQLITSLDSAIQHMAWTSVIGAVVGVLFGFRTLFSVLQQYKRALIAARERIQGSRSPSQYRSIIEMESPNERWRQARFFTIISFNHLQWPETYPLHGTVYFLGVLVSTVILQFFVAFILVTCILAVLGNPINIAKMALPYWGLVVTSVLSLLIEEFVLGFLWRKILADGYDIKRPYGWVLYMIVSSMVHLILGILRAFARLLGMILVAVLRLGRLDVNQYPIFRSCDTSEMAFGAMVLMQYQVTQRNQAQCNTDSMNVDDAIDSIMIVEASQSGKMHADINKMLGDSPFSGRELHSTPQEQIICDGRIGDEGCSRTGSASESTLQQRRMPPS